ncbi:unnamed protein product [Rotaria sp. Silwood2]|nr:unnamed protein product [Rotaria sp. Silwood2]CAF2646304.1 unnamed protein product [Rotaria sp. Silwood2]CAF2864516.1 unnamed protein product [Rotaria sp. Silwood2]CAF3003701.1 unnamed protein product [Rotaria sp. Silwood2]CAF3867175.1 unnamed protein product [Rotaria sp. Silwood2]
MYNHYEELHKSSSKTYVSSGEKRVSTKVHASSAENYETAVATTYRSAMAPRTISVLQSRPTGLCTSVASAKMRQNYLSTGANAGFGQGLASLVNAAGVPLRGGAASIMGGGVSAGGYSAARATAAGYSASEYGASEYGASEYGASEYGAAGVGAAGFGAAGFGAAGFGRAVVCGAPSAATVEVYSIRIREKRDLVALNDKFATYVEKVRFLEANNRKLVMELDLLRSRLGQGSSHIKDMYDLEMVEANKLIEGSKREHSIVYGRALEAEEILKREKTQHESVSVLRITDQKEVDALKLRIAENEAQIALYRRRMADVEDEVQLYRKESQRLTAELTCVQSELQNELFLKSSCEFERMTLEDQLSNIKQIHEADLFDVRSKLVSSDLNPSLYFRNELALAIREIRKDYETHVESQRCDMHRQYTLSVNEIVIQNQSLFTKPSVSQEYRRESEEVRVTLLEVQNQKSYLSAQNEQIQYSIADLERKLKAFRESNSLIITKYDSEIAEARAYLARTEETYTRVMASKVSLETEIATYRRYLESTDGLRGYVDRIEQVAQLKLIDRSSSSSSLYVSGGKELTKASSSSYINAGGSNYSYGASKASGYLSNLGTQAASKTSVTQSYSSSTLAAPRRVEASRTSIYQESGRSSGFQAQSSMTQESAKRSSLIQSGVSSRESLTRGFVAQSNSKRASLLRDGASSSHESLSYENSFEDNTRDGEYDAMAND